MYGRDDGFDAEWYGAAGYVKYKINDNLAVVGRAEIFREQVWATYQQDLVGLNLIEFFGDGHVLWASDYPHPDSTWPRSREVVERETAHLDHETKRKILRDNAKVLYGI